MLQFLVGQLSRQVAEIPINLDDLFSAHHIGKQQLYY